MFRGPNLRNLITVPYAIFEKNLENYGRKLLLANSNFTGKGNQRLVQLRCLPASLKHISEGNLKSLRNLEKRILLSLLLVLVVAKMLKSIPVIVTLRQRTRFSAYRAG